ncbi:hypothetical protein [Streptomyces sp. NPDC050704]|uniref:hypothetical protein n=1 Tax=Streptomyces sp. NPDC050704 TaxID=3157219 RepID=UPI003427C74A
MLTGVLIAESLRVGAELDSVPLRVTKVSRISMPSASPAQPGEWTLLDFEAPDEDAGPLAASLANGLARQGGWYVDFHTADEVFVVFADRVFRYARGDAEGRAAAVEYGRSVGVPESQLDWGD